MSWDYEIYTDGACSGNPGPGGWGALLRSEDGERELSGYEDSTTNNRMEMMAAIEALRAVAGSRQVRLVTDSEYLRKGMTEWMQSWKARGWKTAARKPVKNVDLWQILDQLVQGVVVEWVWVKGHSGCPENERVDALARQAIASHHAAQ